MTFGTQIKKLRNEQNLSQPQLAELAGIEQSYLSKLENDKSVPSNEIFRQLLTALNTTIDQLLKSVNSSADKQQLSQIPDVELWYLQQDDKNIERQRRLLYTSSALIVLAVTLFYIGFSKQVFSEIRYHYSSPGVVLAGEPQEIFHSWSMLIEGESGQIHELRRKKQIEMTQRADRLYIDTETYLGRTFSKDVAGGKRYFHEKQTAMVPRPINSWLQMLGVLLFSAGIMGFVLERKLSK